MLNRVTEECYVPKEVGQNSLLYVTFVGCHLVNDGLPHGVALGWGHLLHVHKITAKVDTHELRCITWTLGWLLLGKL